MKFKTKTLSAVVAAALLAFLAAVPAAATPVSFEITDGLLQTAIGNFPLERPPPPPPAPQPPCNPSPVGTITSDIVAPVPPATSYTSTITALSLNGSVSLSGNAYLTEISLDTAGGTGPNSGTIASPSGAVTHSLRVLVSIYATTGTPPNCVKAALVCRVRVIFAGSLSGTATPVPPSASGDTITLSGSGNVSAVLGQPCNPPFAAVIGTTASFPVSDPLELTVP